MTLDTFLYSVGVVLLVATVVFFGLLIYAIVNGGRPGD